MNRMSYVALPVIFGLLGSLLLAQNRRDAGDSAEVDKDFAFQGEYVGEAGEENATFGVQVIALGEGKFRAVIHRGGVPGAGWDGEEKIEVEGELENGTPTFRFEETVLTIEDGVFVGRKDDQVVGRLKKIERKSSSFGKKPPAGAVVLFDGTTAEQFENGRMTDDKLLMQGVTSKRKFGDFQLHLEFRLPYMPSARGQARANSGCYLQGRYEVQILDSFGLVGKNNECGGIYQQHDPAVNMCFPPHAWQTYDIDFTAARFDESGKKVKNARVTLRHNGVVIHNDVELPGVTGGNLLPENSEPGPIHLQDHGNPVRFRNIWVVEK